MPDFMVPFVPILQKGEPCFSMFADLQRKYDWVLDVLTSDSTDTIVQALDELILAPALAKHAALMARKGEALRVRGMKEMLRERQRKD